MESGGERVKESKREREKERESMESGGERVKKSKRERERDADKTIRAANYIVLRSTIKICSNYHDLLF